MAEVLIGLGGNEGDVADAFHTALANLGRVPGMRLENVSPFHVTPGVTWGRESATPYLNAAARFESSLEPLAVLDLLQDQEARSGRVRQERWGRRPLDLDLLFHGDRIVESEGLIVPHPAAWYRRFVLDPLVQIASEFVHPEKGLTLRDLRERLLVRPLTIGLAGELAKAAESLQSLFDRPDIIRVKGWFPGEPEPTLLVHRDGEGGCRQDQLPQLPLVRWWPAESNLQQLVTALAYSALGPDSPFT